MRLAFPTRPPGNERISWYLFKVGCRSGFEVVLPVVFDLGPSADRLNPFGEPRLPAIIQELVPDLRGLLAELFLAGPRMFLDDAHEGRPRAAERLAPCSRGRAEKTSYDLRLGAEIPETTIPRDASGGGDLAVKPLRGFRLTHAAQNRGPRLRGRIRRRRDLERVDELLPHEAPRLRERPEPFRLPIDDLVDVPAVLGRDGVGDRA